MSHFSRVFRIESADGSFFRPIFHDFLKEREAIRHEPRAGGV